MSINIYNGKKFKNYPTVNELNKVYQTIKGKIQAAAQEEYYRINAEILKRLYIYYKTGVADISIYGLDFTQIKIDEMTFEDMALYSAQLSCELIKKNTAKKLLNIKCLNEENKDKYHKNSCYRDLCFYAFMFVLPVDDKILVTSSIGNESLLDCMIDEIVFEDYSYWELSSKPKELSDKEWGRRKQDWNKVCNKNSSFNNGFTLSFFSSNPLDDIHTGFDVVKDLNKYLTNISSIVYQAAHSQYYKKELYRLLNDQNDNYIKIYKDVQESCERNKEKIKLLAQEYEQNINFIDDFKDVYVSDRKD